MTNLVLKCHSDSGVLLGGFIGGAGGSARKMWNAMALVIPRSTKMIFVHWAAE